MTNDALKALEEMYAVLNDSDRWCAHMRTIRAALAQPKVDLTEQHLNMFSDTNNLKPLWFISKAKEKVGRNPAIVSEQDLDLIAAFLEVVRDNIQNEEIRKV